MIGRHHPRASIEVWSQDEARLGLIPIVRRMWSPRGERPIALNRRRYEWVYVYCFVHPSTGRTEWLLLPTVNTELFQQAIDYFAQAISINESRQVILVVDRAGWHMSKHLQFPKGLHIFALPSHSPELQPSERLWPLLREAVANQHFFTMDEFENKLVERSQELRGNPQLIHRHTMFDWWAHATVAERLS